MALHIMFSLNKEKSQTVITFGLFLLYFIFYTNLIIDSGSSWSLVKIAIILTIISFFAYKRIYLSKTVITISILPFLFITMNEYIFHSQQISSDDFFNKQAARVINQFIYVLPLIFLPTLIKNINFKEKIFFQILLYATILSVFMNSYWIFKFGFNRDVIAHHFESIILYDFCVSSLSLVALTYSFQLNKKSSYFFIFICLINIALIILHGSRGAWLGIPIALLAIIVSYYKNHRSQILFILSLFFITTISSIYIPNSPIVSRIHQFNQDSMEIKKNNYNSSVGNRIALWNLSLSEFQKSPITGIGIKQFKEDICKLKTKGIIPDCNPHAHNVFLQELASHGILGLISILIVFFLPIIYFTKSLIRTNNMNVKTLSLSGMVFVTYVIICSLTDYFFFTKFPTLLYFLTTTSLISFIFKHKEPL